LLKAVAIKYNKGEVNRNELIACRNEVALAMGIDLKKRASMKRPAAASQPDAPPAAKRPAAASQPEQAAKAATPTKKAAKAATPTKKAAKVAKVAKPTKPPSTESDLDGSEFEEPDLDVDEIPPEGLMDLAAKSLP